MFKTKIDLAEPLRFNMIALLNLRVADCIDLALQAKQAHWNVKGPNFRSLHKLFDKVSEEIQTSGDLLAERLVQLGGVAEGTVEAVADRSGLQVYSLLITDESDHLAALSTSIAECGKAMRESVEYAANMKDAGTSDLLLKVSQTLDQYLWMVEAHIDNKSRELMEAVEEEKPVHARQLKSASGS